MGPGELLRCAPRLRRDESFPELYNAKQAPNGRDVAEHGVQFYAPMVANGKVYFGTRSHLYAYGLLSVQSN